MSDHAKVLRAWAAAWRNGPFLGVLDVACIEAAEAGADAIERMDAPNYEAAGALIVRCLPGYRGSATDAVTDARAIVDAATKGPR